MLGTTKRNFRGAKVQLYFPTNVQMVDQLISLLLRLLLLVLTTKLIITRIIVRMFHLLNRSVPNVRSFPSRTFSRTFFADSSN